MSSLKITELAWRVIRKELERTSVADPVIYLIEVSQEAHPPPELGRAILDGADEATIREITERLYGCVVPKSPRRLVAAVYPRNQMIRWFLQVINGVSFYFPPTISSKVAAGTLDWENEGLVLKDESGAVLLPSR